MMSALHTSDIKSLRFLSRGKVRDIYEIDEKRLLILQSDRVSAFDVVMSEAIPQKGAVLTEMSYFWFERLQNIVKNHLLTDSVESVLSDESDLAQAAGRSMVVRRLNPLPIEAVCRGYIIGSGWKDYRATGEICGIALPEGLQLADQLPEVLFTPATKAEQGEHDENISFARMADIVGAQTAEKIRDVSCNLYRTAAQQALEKGIIIADTKFEFALDDDTGELILIDEVLTPDSSRYWVASDWKPGENPSSFDKQYLRDWLEASDWNKKAPPPPLSEEVIAYTSEKYTEIKNILL